MQPANNDRPENEWAEEEFVPPAPEASSVDELLHALKARYRDRDRLDDPRYDHHAIENLRLLICVRTIQNWFYREVLAELIAIGLVLEYAEELIATTQTGRRTVPLESGTCLTYRQGLPTMWNDALHERRRRLTMRASHRLQLAGELTGLDPWEPDVPPLELVDQPEVVPPATPSRASRSRKAFNAILIALLVLGLIGLLFDLVI